MGKALVPILMQKSPPTSATLTPATPAPAGSWPTSAGRTPWTNCSKSSCATRPGAKRPPARPMWPSLKSSSRPRGRWPTARSHPTTRWWRPTGAACRAWCSVELSGVHPTKKKRPGKGLFFLVGGGRGLVPGLAVHLGLPQPVAHKLFVVARWVLASGQGGLVAFPGPVARAVGREHFVHQHQRAIGRQAKLELGVGNDHAFGERDVGSSLVDRNAQVADAGGELKANHLHRALERDVFIVLARSGLGGWGVDGLGQLGGIGQPFWQGYPAHRA